jgi:hypothetical protein
VCVLAAGGTSLGMGRKVCALARKAHGDQSGSDFGRRTEGSAGNFKDKFGASVELGGHGEVAIGFCRRLSGEAKGDLRLNDEVHFVNDIGEVEEVMEDGRGDVEGEVAVDADTAAGGDRSDVSFENVAGDDGEPGRFFGDTPKTCDEGRVELDGKDRHSRGEKMLGHFAVAGTDFYPTGIAGRAGGRRGVGRNADGARDLLAPLRVGKEMLAKTLTSHTAEKCSRNVRGDSDAFHGEKKSCFFGADVCRIHRKRWSGQYVR